jgi:hypothetical protein
VYLLVAKVLGGIAQHVCDQGVAQIDKMNATRLTRSPKTIDWSIFSF